MSQAPAPENIRRNTYRAANIDVLGKAKNQQQQLPQTDNKRGRSSCAASRDFSSSAGSLDIGSRLGLGGRRGSGKDSGTLLAESLGLPLLRMSQQNNPRDQGNQRATGNTNQTLLGRLQQLSASSPNEQATLNQARRSLLANATNSLAASGRSIARQPSPSNSNLILQRLLQQTQTPDFRRALSATLSQQLGRATHQRNLRPPGAGASGFLNSRLPSTSLAGAPIDPQAYKRLQGMLQSTSSYSHVSALEQINEVRRANLTHLLQLRAGLPANANPPPVHFSVNGAPGSDPPGAVVSAVASGTFLIPSPSATDPSSGPGLASSEGHREESKRPGQDPSPAPVPPSDQQHSPNLLNRPAAHSDASSSSHSARQPVDKEVAKKAHPKPALAAARPAKKRRAVLKSHQQAVNIPHFNERAKAALGIDEDHNWLSEFQCFARMEMMEVFQANEADVVVRSTSKSVKLNQVGVRCRFCAHVPHSDRANRSSAFPSGLSKIYQSFNMMVRDHFANCSEVPARFLDEYLSLKGKNSQGACDSRHYWYYAAKKLGMVDTHNGRGIEMTEETKLKAKEMPPYGTTESTEEGKKEEVASSAASSSCEDLALVKEPQDQSCASPFLYELLSNLQKVRLLPAERVGKRKTLPIGLEGFGCRYCHQVGRLGFSRCYPLRRRGLSAQIYDMHSHLQRCTLCPQPVKLILQQLIEAKPELLPPKGGAKRVHKSGSSPPVAGEDAVKEAEFLDLIWSRLGRTSDLTT